MKKQKTFENFIAWYDLPLAERNPIDIKGFSGLHKVSLVTLYKWQKAIEKERGVSDDGEITKFLTNAYNQAMQGKNPMWARLWWDIKNPDKKTKEAEFTADDYINIGIKVKEQLRKELNGGDGVCPLCGRHKEVRNEPCLGAEPRREED